MILKKSVIYISSYIFQSRRSKMATVGEQTQVVSNHTKDKATKAKVTLENYYSNLISQNEERENR